MQKHSSEKIVNEVFISIIFPIDSRFVRPILYFVVINEFLGKYLRLFASAVSSNSQYNNNNKSLFKSLSSTSIFYNGINERSEMWFIQKTHSRIRTAVLIRTYTSSVLTVVPQPQSSKKYKIANLQTLKKEQLNFSGPEFVFAKFWEV